MSSTAPSKFATGEAVRLRLEVKDRQWWMRLFWHLLAVCILWGVVGYAFFIIWKGSLFVMDAYVAVVLMVSTVITCLALIPMTIPFLSFTGFCPSIVHTEILAPGYIERRVLWRVHRYELAGARVVYPGEEWGWRFGIVLRDRFQRPFKLPFLTRAEIDLVSAYVDEANRAA